MWLLGDYRTPHVITMISLMATYSELSQPNRPLLVRVSDSGPWLLDRSRREKE
jgi:hypothetical protein